MKKVTIRLKSLEELSKKGFREHDGTLILGRTQSPTSRIPAGLMPYLGEEIPMVDYRERDWGNELSVYVQDATGERAQVPHCLLDRPVTKIPGLKVQKTIVGDKVAQFNGFSFKFPCRAENLPAEEARKLAKWVLEVSK